jgi:predicted flap endonuclease-1-like 5' DNA nuclease
LVAATVLWALMRRRANAVRWVEPPATLPVGVGIVPVEPGTPGELPDDVLATDAGLTELPDGAEGTLDTVDEVRVAEILAESPDADVVVVDEASYEQAVADAAPEPPVTPPGADAEAVATGPAPAEPIEDSPEAALEADAPAEQSAEAGLEAGVPAGAAAEQSTEAGLGAGVPAGAAAEESTEAGLEARSPSGASADDEPTERELPAPGVDEATVTLRTGRPDRGVPMPSFSEAPTAEIPATDNLRAIRGIGPSMERKLQGVGIVSYQQLALLDGAELERVRAELDVRGRIEREDWTGQARALYREKYGQDPS